MTNPLVKARCHCRCKVRLPVTFASNTANVLLPNPPSIKQIAAGLVTAGGCRRTCRRQPCRCRLPPKIAALPPIEALAISTVSLPLPRGDQAGSVE